MKILGVTMNIDQTKAMLYSGVDDCFIKGRSSEELKRKVLQLHSAKSVAK